MDVRHTTRVTIGALASCALLLTAPQDAAACGGMFCGGASGPQQVNQTAERIIFSKNADGTVTAVVQILYEGEADRFGWVLPVRGIPDVDVSSDAAFTALQAATNPTFQLNTTVEGSCSGGGGLGVGGGCASEAPAGDFSGNNEAFEDPVDAVVVLDSGSVGPYDYVILQIDSGNGDNVEVALDWLQSNNYQATNVGPELIAPYLDEGYNLLAMRLQKSQTTGAIRPLRMTYDDDHPMIPIKLTAVASTDDMGVLVWVLGDSRAVPVNYKSLELNDALLDWFQPQLVYDDVVGLAANEASGQGFVTEYAQDTRDMSGIVFDPAEGEWWDDIREQDWMLSPTRVIDLVIERYSDPESGTTWDGLEEAIDQSFPGASSVQKARILECGSCAFQGSAPSDFSPETFLQAVDDFVVGPMRETQELFDDAAYVTRLYTNISPHEMTLDPSFGFNADLPDVDNDHVAERVIECDSSVSFSNAPWRTTVPSGFVVRGNANTWPFVAEKDGELPATIAVRQMGTSGEGEIVRDNVVTIRQALDRNNLRFEPPDGNGCASAPVKPDAWFLGLVLALLLRRRRR